MTNNKAFDDYESWDLVAGDCSLTPTIDHTEESTNTSRMKPEGAVSTTPQTVHQYLKSKGLVDKHIVGVLCETEATSIEDLSLLSSQDVEQVVQTLQLKTVTAEKFRRAVEEQRRRTSKSTENDVTQRDVTVQPKELIAICIDRSGSMGSPLSEKNINYVPGSVQERSRMDAVKAMFYAFRDCVDQYQRGSKFNHQLGLIQFDQHVERLLEITPDLQKFERLVDEMKQRGRTAIFSAILEAADMLEEALNKFSPGTIDVRILVLSDGQSNAGTAPLVALRAVAGVGAVVDALIVGNRPDASLLKIVSVTGGQAWQIDSLGEGFELLENEGVVALEARRGGKPKPPPRSPDSIIEDFHRSKLAGTTSSPTMIQKAATVSSQFAKEMSSFKVTSAKSTVHNSRKTECRIVGLGKRIIHELIDFVDRSGDGSDFACIHIFPCETDIKVWRVLVGGPPNSPFEGGTFLLSVRFPADYPFKPPKVVFETPVYHCNITCNGSICLDLLRDTWSPALTIPKVIMAIRELLACPDMRGIVRSEVAELTMAYKASNGADTRYYDEAARQTKQHASRNVLEWMSEWHVDL